MGRCKSRNLYYVYALWEVDAEKYIYVGSTGRLSPRLKEHRESAEGKRKHRLPLYDYLNKNNLELFKDVVVHIIYQVDGKAEALEKEELLYHKYRATLTNTRPADYIYKGYNPKSKEVYCLNNNTIYSSIQGASENFPFSPQTISRVLTGGKQYHTYGNTDYYFCYI